MHGRHSPTRDTGFSGTGTGDLAGDHGLGGGSVVANPSSKQATPSFSLLTPSRVPIPETYNAPSRAPDPVALLTSEAAAHRELFSQLKSKTRSHSSTVSMSAGRDFELLATASRRSGDDMKAAIALFNLGVTHDNSRQYGKAIESYRKFLKVAKHTGNLYAQCLAFNSIAVSYHYKGDIEESLAYHARHAKIAPDFRNQVIALCNAGLAQHKLGRVDGARECCRSALDIAVASGDSSGEMLASGLLGLATAQSKPLRPVSREDDAGAGAGVGAGASAAASGEDSDEVAARTLAHAELGRAALERQLALQATTDDPRNRVIAHEQLGLLASVKGDHAVAFEHFKQARKYCRQSHDSSRGLLDKCSMGIALANQRMAEYFETLRAKAAGEIAPDALVVLDEELRGSPGSPASPTSR